MRFNLLGRIALRLGRYGFFKKMSDEKYLKMVYKLFFGKKLDLNNPTTYNQKLQWLKINDRNPLYTTLVDKYEAKKYVAGIIGDNHIIPTLGVWERFEDIDFDSLPNEFVLKCTHDSGCVVICKDKKTFDYKAAKKKITKALSVDYFYLGREWPYKNVKHRIIAEKYMVDESSYELKDYKFFCFNGEVKAMFIASDRNIPNEETKFDFYDPDFNLLPFTNGHPNSKKEMKKPESFELMKSFAQTLSKGLKHVRVDFYCINKTIYFGEITFYHWSGFVPFKPDEWDNIFGEWLDLNKS